MKIQITIEVNPDLGATRDEVTEAITKALIESDAFTLELADQLDVDPGVLQFRVHQVK